MISLCEKVRLQQLRKAKCSILASISDIFQKNFLTEPHTCLYSTLCKSHDFLISFNLDTFFQKCDFLEKFISSFFLEQDLWSLGHCYTGQC